MYTREIELPTPEALKAEMPLPPALANIKEERIKLIEGVLSGREDKFLVIVGPCSAHEPKAVLEYVERLGKLSEKVKGKLVLVPRIFTDKPRTRGVGYKGMFSRPDPEKGENFSAGIRAVRSLHVKAIEASGLAAADELLSPENFEYASDLVAYTVLGARTSETQQHRMLASGLDTPVGVKNAMSGSIPALVNSIYAAQSAQTFLHNNWQVTTSGNEYAHAVLRGHVDTDGNDVPNYDAKTIFKVLEEYHRHGGLKNPALIVDTNHANSGKHHKKQIEIAQVVMNARKHDTGYKNLVKGLMIESFLEEGNQATCAVYGKSITDPCLGWEDTERLILQIAEGV